MCSQTFFPKGNVGLTPYEYKYSSPVLDQYPIPVSVHPYTKHNALFLFQIQQLELQVIDAEKRAFTAHQQVGIQTDVCVCARVPLHVSVCVQIVCVIPGTVDGGEAESARQSDWRLRGAFVSTVPGASGIGAGEGGRHHSAGAAAGGAGKTRALEEFSHWMVFSFFLFQGAI